MARLAAALVMVAMTAMAIVAMTAAVPAKVAVAIVRATTVIAEGGVGLHAPPLRNAISEQGVRAQQREAPRIEQLARCCTQCEARVQRAQRSARWAEHRARA